MRPTFMGFETATRGMMAQQKALDIVGNNVGNIGVTGYTRQRVDMVSMALSNTNGRYAANPTGRAGQGVNVTGISQIRDPFLDKRFREEYADVGYYNKLNDVLGDIESAIDEIEPSNMTTAIANFKDAWQKMTNKDPVTTNTVLAAARTMTQVFKQMDTKLNSTWSQQKYDLEVNVNSVNNILSGIADLNKTIKDETFNNITGNASGAPNELLDARNVLLDKLSEFGDVQITTNEDSTVTVKMGKDGHTVVDGNWNELLTMPVLENGVKVTDVKWQTEGKSANLTSGSIKASLDMLNGRGTAAQPVRGEGFDKGILYYKDKIDTFANTFAKTFNDIIPIYDDMGNEIGKKQLFSMGSGEDFTAGNIDINSVWAENSNFMLENAHKPGEGIDYTDFANRAVAAFTKEQNFGEFKGTFDGYVSFYSVANLGNQRTNVTSRFESCSEISENILKSISAVSGVSMEEEGVDMVQYTKAYNAMGRVMTALDEALDTLISKTGLVGR